LGIAKEVMAQLKVALPQVVDDPGFATTYWMMSPGFGGAPVDVLSTGFATAASTAAGELSSAAGGGGGFSGGGGGGFGGGGGGGAD
jgi:uncharacterized membrane protein